MNDVAALIALQEVPIEKRRPYIKAGSLVGTMDAADIVIRRATFEDAERMSAYSNVIADEGLNIISNQRYTAGEELAFLNKISIKERAFFLLALDGPLVVGILDFWAGEKPFNRHAGELGMSVLQEYRRKGIGRRLLQAAIQETKGWSGFCRIELNVFPQNIPAIRLYESAGFVREGIRQRTLSFSSEPCDLVLMGLVWWPGRT